MLRVRINGAHPGGSGSASKFNFFYFVSSHDTAPRSSEFTCVHIKNLLRKSIRHITICTMRINNSMHHHSFALTPLQLVSSHWLNIFPKCFDAMQMQHYLTVLRIRIRDPVPFCPPDPGSGIGFFRIPPLFLRA
jgi:hypothetical protein